MHTLLASWGGAVGPRHQTDDEPDKLSVTRGQPHCHYGSPANLARRAKLANGPARLPTPIGKGFANDIGQRFRGLTRPTPLARPFANEVFANDIAQ